MTLFIQFMNIPWAFILVGTNESLKKVMITKENRNFFSYFACAALAGVKLKILKIF